MNSDLKKLILLQELTVNIRDSRRKIQDTPRRVAEIEETLREAERGLENARNRQEEGQKERRKLEGHLADLEERLSRYQDQIFSVKKNEEYQALMKEIGNAKEEIRRTEDRILERMEEMEGIQEEILSKDRACQHARISCEQQKSECLQESERLAGEVTRMEEEQRQVEASLGRDLLARFERIARVRDGVAVAAVIGESCQLCHVRVRPQAFQDLKLGSHLVQCGTCNRFLYLTEERPDVHDDGGPGTQG